MSPARLKVAGANVLLRSARGALTEASRGYPEGSAIRLYLEQAAAQAEATARALDALL